MAGRSLRKELADLLQGAPGWRLEPRATPGASPLWCFVSNGKIEFSVTAEGSGLVLYVMDTDQEVQLADRDQLAAWLGQHRPDALQDPQPRADAKTRARKFFEWG
jgi:hypothetical protein